MPKNKREPCYSEQDAQSRAQCNGLVAATSTSVPCRDVVALSAVNQSKYSDSITRTAGESVYNSTSLTLSRSRARRKHDTTDSMSPLNDYDGLQCCILADSKQINITET